MQRDRRNPFVEIALASALNLAKQMDQDLVENLEIVIVGDNDFYSQQSSVSRAFFLLNCVSYFLRLDLYSTFSKAEQHTRSST